MTKTPNRPNVSLEHQDGNKKGTKKKIGCCSISQPLVACHWRENKKINMSGERRPFNTRFPQAHTRIYRSPWKVWNITWIMSEIWAILHSCLVQEKKCHLSSSVAFSRLFHVKVVYFYCPVWKKEKKTRLGWKKHRKEKKMNMDASFLRQTTWENH